MRDFNACCSFECVDQFQYGNAVAGSEVEDFHIIQRLATQHAVHGNHVSLSQVDNIDVVADAGTVRRVIVVTEYTQLFADTHSSLCQIRDQVLRNAVRQFADLCCRMCSDRVEVTQDDALERSAGMDRVADDLFVDLFCISVWRSSRFDRSVLGYRQILRVRLPVNGTGRREYNAFDIEFRHQFQQVHQCHYVVAVVFQRLLYGFAYCFAGGKQDNPFDSRMSFQCFAGSFLIFQVQLDEFRTDACDAFDTVQYFYIGVRQVIDDDNFITCVLQFYCGV